MPRIKYTIQRPLLTRQPPSAAPSAAAHLEAQEAHLEAQRDDDDESEETDSRPDDEDPDAQEHDYGDTDESSIDEYTRGHAHAASLSWAREPRDSVEVHDRHIVHNVDVFPHVLVAQVRALARAACAFADGVGDKALPLVRLLPEDADECISSAPFCTGDLGYVLNQQWDKPLHRTTLCEMYTSAEGVTRSKGRCPFTRDDVAQVQVVRVEVVGVPAVVPTFKRPRRE